VSTREATFGFVDLAGFTALTEAHGDVQAVEMLDRFGRIVQTSVEPAGELVKTIGDAVMLTWSDPGAAVEGVERLFAACLAVAGLPLPRAGLHHGTAIERDGDYIGAAVNLAARVTDQAHGGQVLVTDVVAVVARAQGFLTVSLGPIELRNVTAPVELFELRLGATTGSTVIDPVCRMQVALADAAGVLRHGGADYWFCSFRCAAAFATQPDRYVGMSSS
jgi:adenylate cyclase